MSTTPRATPTQTEATTSSATKQPISWVDVEDDDDFGFDLPVQTGGIKAADAPATPPPAAKTPSPTKEEEGEGEASQDKTLASTATNKTVVTKKKKATTQQQGGAVADPATQVKSKTPLANLEKNEAAKSFVQRELLARNLFPSFVEVTVDGAVPYSLKSTAAINLEGVDGALSPAAKMNSSLGGEGSGSEAGNSPVQPDTSRRAVFEAAEPVKTATPSRLQSHQLPAAIAATVNINVADRSHLGRRRRAIRVVADTLVSNGGKAMNVNDVVKLTKWNKTFRPGLGCLFSFIKSLPAFFVYHHGMISLTYEEDIASSMLRTWSETDPQAAELTNIAATNAAAIAVTQDSSSSGAPTAKA